jgi:hypothetical protein
MLEVFLVLVVIILVIGLCLHHYSMKKKLAKTTEQDCAFVRASAEHSIMASNTVNPVIALTEVTKAVQIIECLHDRYGPETSSDITNIDTVEMLNVLQNQKERVLQDVMQQNPNFLPNHPLNQEAGFVSRETEDERKRL